MSELLSSKGERALRFVAALALLGGSSCTQLRERFRPGSTRTDEELCRAPGELGTPCPRPVQCPSGCVMMACETSAQSPTGYAWTRRYCPAGPLSPPALLGA